MMRTLAAAAAIFLLSACERSDEAPTVNQGHGSEAPKVAPILAGADAVDPASYARPLEARVTHVALDLGVDFDTKRVSGTATLDIDRKPGAKEIILDDKGLEIQSITDGAKPLQYKVGTSSEELGAPLTVALNPDTKRLVISYKSAPEADALQWLTPEQTAGKKQPYLFSQGQSILNRTWIPTQDSPGIRQTWEARIHVPAPLTAVMSAPRAAEPLTQGGETVFSFNMDKPVAPYLIAIAVGDLKFRSLGKRTGVWTEPAMLDSAAAELADTERMVEAAEKLYGPYRWGRYDLLVLPPSFPYGGMENPTLTFLTPTFIAGDKSLVGLVAHELAHSWSGNLVTNANWSDSWLNEGVTSYFENRIMEAIYGPKRASQEAALSFDEMEKALKEEKSGPATQLHLGLKEGLPDGGSSGIVYDKGSIFLRTLEKIIGREKFDAYLRSYFDRHAFQPMTSARFLADLRANLVKGDATLEDKLQLDKWVYQPGLPGNVARPDPAAFADVDMAVRRFGGGGALDTAAWDKWTTAERLRFLNRLPRKLAKPRLDALEQGLKLNSIGNNEVRFAWLDLAIGNRYDPAVPSAEQFIGSQGRGKFVRPLITALAEDKQWGRPIAVRVYAKSRPLYHPSVTKTLDKLGLSAS